MMFTFKKVPLSKALIGANGRECNPYKALEVVCLNEDEEPLEGADLLEFIEENYPALLELCTQAHEAWKSEEAPKVVH